ncbi:MAG: hypothetical protein AB7K09_10035 [Planctomycetota bacterium]
MLAVLAATIAVDDDARMLRVSLGLHEQWWLAAAAALVCVAIIVLLFNRYGTPANRVRLLRLVLVFSVLAFLFGLSAVTLATNGFWTPADNPARFNKLIAGANYALLAEWRARAAQGDPVTLANLAALHQGGTVQLNPHVAWPLMRDAEGKPLRVDTGDLLVTDAGDTLPAPQPGMDR